MVSKAFGCHLLCLSKKMVFLAFMGRYFFKFKDKNDVGLAEAWLTASRKTVHTGRKVNISNKILVGYGDESSRFYFTKLLDFSFLEVNPSE